MVRLDELLPAEDLQALADALDETVGARAQALVLSLGYCALAKEGDGIDWGAWEERYGETVDLLERLGYDKHGYPLA